MTLDDLSNSYIEENSKQLPRLNLATMFRLGLFQMGLGMMSVLVFGVLNRVLIRELGVPPAIATVILALTLFVAPARVWFGQMSDTKPLWGYHRTGYVWIGAAGLAIISFLAVQVMWQVGSSLKAYGWTAQTYGWAALLALLFALYGLAVSASSTPFATLLVDVSDEDNRSKLVGIDWSMLIGGTIIGAITIGILLKKLTLNAPIEEVQTAINRLFLVVPLIVFALAFVSTWGIEKKYSRYAVRSTLVNQEEKITLGRAWRILTASRQTSIFFTFLVLTTLGLFMQDPILETYGGDVFNMEIGATASLNAYWGTGTLIGISAAGFLLTPRIGKRNTAKVGCILVIVSLIWVVMSGFTHKSAFLQIALLFFGLASGILTTGALTMMLDLTVAETAGTFIGAWGLSQALAKGVATVVGGAVLQLGTKLFADSVLAYGLVFALQAVAMILALKFLERVNVQEFRTNAQQAIAAVMEGDLD
ncbi:BCD family MFS transporter [Microcoleus sp. FACHB-831]|jgi:BCD family chlorophyll transporter-like MFS transporter|uniref:BCD family MFS transporter n=1 Tax=Microcoleus sp. FACHB-831 TaxID=2692827 RepID=UPI001689C67F|nr:BCD family MFS transporter [Microcoleus sp. FACHB-831]MBD1922303.1 BCD family MFS transporter [Microcoleus sp. FACHB-831]